MNSRISHKSPFLGNAFYVVLLIVILFKSMAASTATDGSTPLALTPGAPAGSYPLSGLDQMNPYTGNISFSLSLLGIGGRGNTGYSITRTIEQHWRVDHVVLTDGRELNVPIYNPWTPLDPGYGPGVMYGRQVSDGFCSQGHQSAQTLTRLTFVTPDGTEHELVDKLTMGQPRSSFCWAGLGFARGTVFVPTNGTAMTFVSDSTIYDYQFGTTSLYPTGYLMMRGGTRMRIVNGRTEWVRDRNGNQVSITYPTSTRMIATDPLGRQVIIDKNVSEAAPYGLCDKVTFSGFNGVERYIRISKRNLADVLRSGFSLQTPAVLFPGLDGSSSTNHNPQVVSAIWLPDGRSYQFRYNSYGELARAELPTGGAFEYDYAAGLVSGAASGFFYSPLLGKAQIYRRATEKRVYREGGVLEHKTTTSRTDNTTATNTTVTVDNVSSTGALLTRTKHYFFGNPAQSFDLEPLEYPKWKHGREYKTEILNTDGTTVLRRVEQTWQQPAAGYEWPLSQPETNDSAKANNSQITQMLTTLDPATANHVSQQLYSYDIFLNKTDVWEYGFGVGAPTSTLRRTQTLYLLTNPVNSLDYASPTPSASSIHIRDLPETVRIYSYTPQETLASETQFVYDETALTPWYGAVTQWASPGSARGNATKTRVWLNPGNTWLESRAQYDQVGNTSKSWDPRNNATETVFSGTHHFAYPTQTTSAVPDPTGQYGSTTALVTTASYDLSTGLPTSTTDANNQTTTTAYNDALNRPTQVVRGVGSSAQTQTTFSYDDVNRTITATSDLHAANDNVIKVQTEYDGLGRSIKMRQYEGGANNIVTETQYDALGRAHKVSNPYRQWLGETAVWSTTQFDALERAISVTTADNAVVSTSYSGNTVTVTDQAGKVRRSVTDPLGRLVAIYEDPSGLNYLTSYDYDGLDNLIKVTQGSQQRFFMYDSLKRLIRARNPEQSTLASLNLSDPLTGNSAWSNGYQYDANGNLTQKTDPRGVVSTYVYDPLNRNTTADYSDTGSINPDVKRVYDGATNGKGRFWYFYSGGNFSAGNNVEHTSIDSYDALGRPLVKRQLFKLDGTWSGTYQISRTYNQAGGVNTQTYPSGRSVTYNYDAAGRVGDKDASNLAFTGNLGDGVLRTYASGITYSSWNSLAREQFGTNTPLYRKSFYNIRGQLFDTRVSSVNDTWDWNRGRLILYYSSNHVWGQSGTDNNGNVRFAETWIPPENATLDQAQVLIENILNYDALNRLTSVTEQKMEAPGWVWQQQFHQAYTYDRYGNRTINTALTSGIGINNKAFTVDTATNRLGVPGGQPGVMSYDNAGNLTSDTYSGAGTRTYDAENRMLTATDYTGQTSRYSYDADGRRTRRLIAGSQQLWQVYGFDNELLAEYRATVPAVGPEKEYGYRNGQLLVTATGRLNVAAAANGAVATASSAHTCCGFSTTGAINGNFRGPWGQGEGWNDATENVVPDWIQVDFAGSKTIDEINVFSLHDNYTQENNPTLTQTFSLYGLISFNVQYWNGSTWVTIPGGSVTGNNKVWRNFAFSPITTSKIRVFINTVPDAWSRVVEIQAFGTAGNEKVQWLVTDQLSTPRMVVDLSGSLAGTKRHDYLPFGEELFAGTGCRTNALGYSGDGIRQQFTLKERDSETGLDYFLARYYSSTQGRFTSPDEFSGGPTELFVLGTGNEEKQALPYAEIANPQSLNKYTYVYNNPLRFTDPDGHQSPDTYVNLLLRWFTRQLDPEAEADEPRRPPLSLDGDKAAGRYTQKVGDNTLQAAEMLESVGLDFGVTELARQMSRENAAGTGIAAAFVVLNITPAGKGKQGVVIGEKMIARVIPVAERIGAKYYKATETVAKNWIANNTRWIKEQIASGKRIFDIGPESGRINSPYYQVEVDQLQQAGFTRVQIGPVNVDGQIYMLYEWVRK